MSVARILVIDAGTTGTRALVYDEDSAVLAQSYTEFPQYHPGPDRVEHDAHEIWAATLLTVTCHACARHERWPCRRGGRRSLLKPA